MHDWKRGPVITSITLVRYGVIYICIYIYNAVIYVCVCVKVEGFNGDMIGLGHLDS